MASRQDGFGAMLDIWQQGQDAFFKAQKEVAEGFAKSLSTSPTPTAFPGQAESLQAWQDFIKSWAPQWDPSAMMAGQSPQQTFTMGQDQLFAMLDTSNWMNHAPEQLRSILQTVANGPRFADLAAPQMDAAEAWREAIDYQRAATDFAKALQEAWTQAFQKFSENYTVEDLQSGNVNEAVDAWLMAANGELLKVQRSPEFMDAQRRLVRAATEIKARQRDLAEAWSEAYQMPTRTEVDDLARIVNELRREVRKLKREVAAAKAAAK